MAEPVRAGGCGTSDSEARIDLAVAQAEETIKGWNLPPWPEPATRNYLALAKTGGHPDPAHALLILEEWLKFPEGSAGAWLADSGVQAAIGRGELLFWPGGNLGVLMNPALLQAYLEVEGKSTPAEIRRDVEDCAKALEVLPDYVGRRLGLVELRRGGA